MDNAMATMAAQTDKDNSMSITTKSNLPRWLLQKVIQRPHVVYMMDRKQASLIVVAYTLLLLSLFLNSAITVSLQLLFLISADLFIRYRDTNNGIPGYLLNAFIVALGRRVEIEDTVLVISEREERIAKKIGLFVFKVDFTAERPKKYIYFLRKSHLVLFKLRV